MMAALASAATTAVAVPATATTAATSTGATIAKATTTTTTLASKLLGHFHNRTTDANVKSIAETGLGPRIVDANGDGDREGDGDGGDGMGIGSSSTPTSYLSLYDDVASAFDETQAAEEAGYALIDDISEWLLGAAGGNNLSLSSEATPLSLGGNRASASDFNETLRWLTLDVGEVQNSTLPSSSSSNNSSSNNSSSSSNDLDGDGGGLYALRNFVEQQLNGESAQDAQDIALIDSAEESALESVADGDADYGVLGGFNGAPLEADVDATSELLQRTAATITNRTTAGASYDANAVWLSGAGAHAASAGADAAGAGGVGGRGAGAGAAAGSGAGTGGSSFMLLLENFNDYFPNYNGSTVSGTTVSTTTASSVLLDQNVTSIYFENYRTNCTNSSLNLTTESCHELRIVDHNYWALILILFPILTLFGNILVILSVCRERSLQTVTNYFIVSLAIADLLVAVVVMPFAVYFLVYSIIWLKLKLSFNFTITVDNLWNC
ncbi:dopamine D2-like receptor isoform X2 [Drosophila novamexicana]|uniref:dopamine D2-like receptor isoform X2 n=1 Tax=Drosophila novamexicana TaxID=47314 RepID=UPI0011E5F7C7|nr:dopamine D2-like receptor isoform X2 [Drosophila novamexicana]